VRGGIGEEVEHAKVASFRVICDIVPHTLTDEKSHSLKIPYIFLIRCDSREMHELSDGMKVLSLKV
jgi:hypothetical protein